MVYQWRPGMKMYEAIWERDGERVFGWCMHAANEQDVLAEAGAFFRANAPKFDGLANEDVSVRVQLAAIYESSESNGGTHNA